MPLDKAPMNFIPLPIRVNIVSLLTILACGINLMVPAESTYCLAQNANYRRDKYVFKNLKKARKLIAKKEYEGALSILGKLAQLDPNPYSYSVHGEASRAFYHRDNYAMCINQGLKALRFNKLKASWVIWYIANSNLKMNKVSMARKWFAQYVKAAQNNKEAKERQEDANETVAYYYANKANEALKKGKRVDAKLILEEATKLPQNKQTAYIHGTLAYVFSRLGNTDGTIREALIANSLKPKKPSYMLTLGNAHVKKGDYDQAIEWYQKYIKYADDPKDKKDIQDEIQNLEDDREKANTIAANNPDYLGEISRINIWKKESMPIKVFIPQAEGVKNYRSNFPQLFFEALQAWRKASGNKISYQLLPKPDGANITVTWTADPIAVEQKGRIRPEKLGIARMTSVSDSAIKYPVVESSRITIRVVDPYKGHPLSDDEVKSVCLHEIGHSLGLVEHSRNVRDIMFYMDYSVIPSLTKRDKATIKRLYQDYPPVYSATDSLMTN